MTHFVSQQDEAKEAGVSARVPGPNIGNTNQPGDNANKERVPCDPLCFSIPRRHPTWSLYFMFVDIELSIGKFRMCDVLCIPSGV